MNLHQAPDLLRIDYEAALEKLAWSQLQGPWQLPAELARLAIGAGARSVVLAIEAQRLVLEAPGARLAMATISDFASILDHGLEASDRHRAMVDLEERDAFVLSAIACSTLRSLRLTLGGDQGLRVELKAQRELSVLNAGAADAPDLRLELQGLELEPARASDWLRRVGRFSDVPITLDNQRVDTGFHKPLIRKQLKVPPATPDVAFGSNAGGLDSASSDIAPSGSAELQHPPLKATLAISRRGSTPRLWLLRHGIVATHATIPGYPAFEAAVEMAPVSGAVRTAKGRVELTARATGAALRERLNPYVQSLVDASVGLLIRLGKEGGRLPEPTRERVGRLLLAAALKRRRLSEICGVDIFPLVNHQGRRLVSIDVISRLVRVEEGGTCALDAIPPGRDPRRFALTGHGALVISQSERALLGELQHIVFSNPPTRARRSRFGGLWDQVSDKASRLRFGGGARISEQQLSSDERELLSRLRAAASDTGLSEVELRTGSGRPRTVDGHLLLPREHPTVKAAVRAVARDPVWLYPATVALMSGSELPSPSLRRTWFTRLDPD